MNAVRTHSRDDLVMFFPLLLSVGATLMKGGDGLAWDREWTAGTIILEEEEEEGETRLLSRASGQWSIWQRTVRGWCGFVQ